MTLTGSLLFRVWSDGVIESRGTQQGGPAGVEWCYDIGGEWRQIDESCG